MTKQLDKSLLRYMRILFGHGVSCLIENRTTYLGMDGCVQGNHTIDDQIVGAKVTVKETIRKFYS